MENIMSDKQLLQKYHQFPPEMQMAISAYIELLEKKYADLKKTLDNPLKIRKFGIGKGIVKYMAPDFDEPLDDLADKMY